MGFSKQGYWSGLPLSSTGDLPGSEIEPWPPILQVDALPSEQPGKPIQVITNYYQDLFISKGFIIKNRMIQS